MSDPAFIAPPFTANELALLKQVVQECLRQQAKAAATAASGSADGGDTRASLLSPLAEANAALSIVLGRMGVADDAPLGKHLWTLVCRMARMPGDAWAEKLTQAALASLRVDHSQDADDEDDSGDERNDRREADAGYRSDSAVRRPQAMRLALRHETGYATTHETSRPSAMPTRRPQGRAANRSVLSQKLAREDEAEHGRRRDKQRATRLHHGENIQRHDNTSLRSHAQRQLSPPRMQIQAWKEPVISQAKQIELTILFERVRDIRAGCLLSDALHRWRMLFRVRARKRMEVRQREHDDYTKAVRCDHLNLLNLSFSLWRDTNVRRLLVRRVANQRADCRFLDTFLQQWLDKLDRVRHARQLAQLEADQQRREALFALERNARCVSSFLSIWRAKLAEKRAMSQQAVAFNHHNLMRRAFQIWFCTGCVLSLGKQQRDKLIIKTFHTWRAKRQVREIALARVDADYNDQLLARSFESWQLKISNVHEEVQAADNMLASSILVRWRKANAFHQKAEPILQRRRKALLAAVLDKWRIVLAERLTVVQVGQQAKAAFLFKAWRREAACTRFINTSTGNLQQRFFARWRREVLLRELQAEQDRSIASRALVAWQTALVSMHGQAGFMAQADEYHRQRHARKLQRSALQTWLVRLADQRVQLKSAQMYWQHSAQATVIAHWLARTAERQAALREADALCDLQIKKRFLHAWRERARAKKEADEDALVARFQTERMASRLKACFQHWRRRAQVIEATQLRCDAHLEQVDLGIRQTVFTHWQQTTATRREQLQQACAIDAEKLSSYVAHKLEHRLVLLKANYAEADALCAQRDAKLHEQTWLRWQDRHSALVEMQIKADARAERLRKMHERHTRPRMQRLFKLWLHKMRRQRGLQSSLSSVPQMHSSGSVHGSAHSSLLERQTRIRSLEDGVRRF